MNFIIFNPDELRAESLGCYGHPFVNTPNIDEFSKNGVLFEQCHTQNPVCSPSRCSFMTGLYVHNNGHRSLWNLLKPYEPNLLKYFKSNGYDVAWYGKNDLLSKESFTDSVTYSEVFPNPSWKQTHFFDNNELFYTFLSDPIEHIEDMQDYLYVKRGCEFIKSNHKKPFVLFLPIGKPHPPYTSPKRFTDLYNEEMIDYLKPEKSKAPSYHKYIKEYRGLDKLNENIFKRIQARYLSSISFVDYLFGMILDAVNDAGLEDDTTILFFSDHGDYAGDYKLVEKWPNGMEDVLTRVPLIIKTSRAKKGITIKEPVELFDFMATVMEIADIKPNHHHFAKSLVPQLNGEPGDPNRYVFCEGGYDVALDAEAFEGNPDFSSGLLDKSNIYYPKAIVQQKHPETVCRTVMIRNLEYKYIKRSTGENELYFLKNDPDELNNVYIEYKNSDIVKDFEFKISDWYLKTADTIPFERDSRNKPENFIKKFD